MGYVKKSIILAVCIILISPVPAWAEESRDSFSLLPGEYSQDYVMPESNLAFEGNLRDELDWKNAVENFNDGIELVSYDQNGRIERVQYTDEESVDYDYELDNTGKIIECKLSTKSISIVFTSGQALEAPLPDDNGEEPSSYYDDIGNLGDEGGEEGRPIELIVLIDEDDLGKIATTPISNFRRIVDALRKASEESQEAYETYIHDTEPYYEGMYEEIIAVQNSLKSEGFALEENCESMEEDVISGSERRELVDKVMGYIYAEKEKNVEVRVEEDENSVVDALAAVEKKYREEFLEPSEMIYDKKIKAALEYVNGIIDKILTSKIALYLKINREKEKIDILINLPEAPETTEEE